MARSRHSSSHCNLPFAGRISTASGTIFRLPDHPEESAYNQVIKQHDLNIYQRLCLILAIAPALKPEILDIFFGKNQIYDRRFSEFGGLTNNEHSGFIPTQQTFAFLINGVYPGLMGEVQKTLDKSGPLIREKMVNLANYSEHLPPSTAVLSCTERWLNYFLTGEMSPIEQSPMFPAHRITTKLEWEDVVLG